MYDATRNFKLVLRPCGWQARLTATTHTICEIHRYVHERSGRKNSWWFRRRVPLDLIALIGQNEWRFTLKAHNRDNAVAEAIPYLARTNETIELARRGEWPPITDEQGELIAYKCAVTRKGGMSASP